MSRQSTLAIRVVVSPALVLAAALLPVPRMVTAQPARAVQPAPAPAAESFGGHFTVERHGRGRPMILIPGLSSSGDVWDGLVARYRDTHELHVLTLAGFAGVPPLDAPRFLEAERDAIIRYVRERGLERPILVGHSLGGFLSFWIAATAPDLVGPVVAVDGVPYLVALGDSTATPATMRAQAEATAGMFESFTADQMAAQARLAVMGGIRDGARHDEAIGWSRASHPATVGRAVAEMLTTDLRDGVAAIRVPVLLVAGGGDAPSDEQRERVRRRYLAQVARIRDHRVVVADARHFVMYDAPDFLFETMDAFLAEAAKGATSAKDTTSAAGTPEGVR